ncbi:MAG: hypothetical protein GX752_05360 [Clostridium sp.]|nr:hypothetical protein [Clostridium sp.]
MDINLTNFTFLDGLKITIPSILIVFLILIVLLFIISFFKYLPKDKIVEKTKKSMAINKSNDEDEMVAMLMASIVAKEDFAGDVKIKSIKRIK